MLFGEKYGEEVRIITFDPNYSVELCGGTHVDATGELGYFRFVNESSAAAGVRRIEAVVGGAADLLLRKEKDQLAAIQKQVGTSGEPAEMIHQLIQKNKQLEKDNRQLQRQQGSAALDRFINSAREVDGAIRLVTGEVPHAEMDLLKQLGYEALEKCKEATITILGARNDAAGKVYIVASVTDDLISQRNIKAGKLVAELGRQLGGGGGGQPSLATAGGSKPEKLQEVLASVRELLAREVSA